MANVPLKPAPKGTLLKAATTKIGKIGAAHTGLTKKAAPNTKKNGATLLDKVKRAEQELASVKSTDPNAKFNIARMKSEQIRIDSNDTEYYFVVCCESYAQKIQLLEALKLLRDDQDTYYSAKEFAKLLGIKLTTDHRAYHSLPVNRRWMRFAMPLETPEK